MAIKINNNVVYSNVGESWISGHVPFEFDFPVQSNDVISIYFKRNGNGWADNCKYEVYDNNNNLIVTRDGAGSGSSGGPENVYGLLACSSASALLTPSFITEGASSTRALASFRPRPVL